jgi:hypothetical protein
MVTVEPKAKSNISGHAEYITVVIICIILDFYGVIMFDMCYYAFCIWKNKQID